MDWQSIETVPKDGHRVLVGHVLGWTAVASCRASGKWRSDDGHNMRVAPTHWMPLPAPPAPTSAEPRE